MSAMRSGFFVGRCHVAFGKVAGAVHGHVKDGVQSSHALVCVSQSQLSQPHVGEDQYLSLRVALIDGLRCLAVSAWPPGQRKRTAVAQ